MVINNANASWESPQWRIPTLVKLIGIQPCIPTTRLAAAHTY